MFEKQNIKKLAPVALAFAFVGGTSFAAYEHFSKPDTISNWVETNMPVMKTRLEEKSTGTNVAMIPADFSLASQKATAAVVHIKSTMKAERNVSQMEVPEELKDFFGGRSPFGQDAPQGSGRGEKPQASGSGVIINPDGFIVTNNHVIQGAESLEVTLADKRTFKAKVIGSDPNTDIALIQIEAKNLPALSFGNSENVKVGQWVLAVGNPYNLTSTVTAGIVSAKGRSINILGENSKAPVESFIQTDAAVNPGNSGGALVDLNGNLIGINTAIASQTGSFAGYSFAVPSSIAHKVVEDISKFGSVQRGYLGVGISEVDGAKVKSYDLKVDEGVRVENFADQSAAREAGIKVGDVITKIDGHDIESVAQLQEAIAQHKPGDKVLVNVNRDGADKIVTVALKSSAGTLVAEKSAQTFDNLGIELQDLTAQQKRAWDVEQGVQVSQINAGKVRQNTDMQDGFVITKIDKTPVGNVQQAMKALEGKKGGVMIEGVYPGSQETQYYAIGL
ncbi:Do/DeqQ family serine protease [Dyadobacter koreensis]|uniref:Do/DeqQ family serine protease n=1 Tax=Dyadobacter koreensis TaxID=408657 RepID=A0A1H6VG63_9BACT|nr:Do family serine endopeptidase [Dyadobacter koreensis]SEJ00747.1 Do/DeqQ family serine protease [Dyadobacter koreensis]